jgi:hypothetical protein
MARHRHCYWAPEHSLCALGDLDGNELHRWPLHGLRDRLGIAIIVLVSLKECLDVLRRDQANVMSQGSDLPGDVVRAAAGFQADKATRHIGKPALQLAA